MSKKQPTSQLHTSANSESTADEPTAEEQHQAGMGGSYTVDPVTRERSLVHRTEGASVSNKKQLTDEDGKAVEEAAGTPATDAGTPA